MIKNDMIAKNDYISIEVGAKKYDVSNSGNHLFICENDCTRITQTTSIVEELKNKMVEVWLLSSEPNKYKKAVEAQPFSEKVIQGILDDVDRRYGLIEASNSRNYKQHNANCQDKYIPLFVLVIDGIDKVAGDIKYGSFFENLECLVMTSLESGRKTNGVKKAYLLSGIIRCGECGRSFCGMHSKSNHVQYSVYRCGSKGSGCSSRAINTCYLDDYIKELLGECLFATQNETRLIDMLKGVYIKSYDKMTDELTEIESKIKETESAISEQEELVATSDNRMLKSIAQNGLQELERNLTMYQHEARIAQDKIDTFSKFDQKGIQRNIREYRKVLQKNGSKEVQVLLNKCIRIIKVNNDAVETVIDSQSLMNAYLPLGLSVIEKRDNVARPENHAKRALNFATLSVKVG